MQEIKKLAILFGALMVMFSACDEEEPIPAYIQVNPFQIVVDNPDVEGTASHKVLYGFTYVDNNFVGAYELPATIPVLASGEKEVIIFPGIKNNGITFTPAIYPFYASYTSTINFVEGETQVVDPVVGYKSALDFAFNETFSVSQSFILDRDGDPGSAVTVTNEQSEIFEGAAGKIELDSLRPRIEVASSEIITDLPLQGTPIYLEINYRNDIEFSIGVVGTDLELVEYPSDFLIITPKEEWSKIYFEITDDIIFFGSNPLFYQVVIFSRLPVDGSGEFTTTSGTIYIDNIKLVHLAQ